MRLVTEPQTAEAVSLGARPLSLSEFYEVCAGDRTVELSPAARPALDASRRLLERVIRERRRVYGVTTGFGPLAGQFLDPCETESLQENLLYHLASGVGPLLSRTHTRGLMLARAASMVQGRSGVRPASLELLLTALNDGYTPEVPAIGTVGASGDLTPLAHMTLGLIADRGLRLEGKEGLAFVNGTSAMTGIAALNGELARRAALVALRLSVLYAELMEGRLEAWQPAFGAARPHRGQKEAHRLLAKFAEGSGRLQPSTKMPPVLPERMSGNPAPQDPYTIRCVPQIYGAILDVVRFHNDTVETELNSVTDNPLFFAADDPADDMVLHGGNFYGQHVAFASDALAAAVVKIAIHSERKVARLVDPAMNGGRFPAMLQPNRLGLQSGFMGAQVTSSALLAEMRTQAIPASIQSVPTNGNNQDVNPMGTIAARRTATLVDRLYEVLAIEALALAQAFDLAGGQEFGASSRSLVEWIRAESAHVDNDRPLAPDITRLAARLREEQATALN